MAQGAVHATERFFQMDYLRRLASGTLAEVFGKNYLAKDKFFRALGFSIQAQTEYANIDPNMKQIVDSYTLVCEFYYSHRPGPLCGKASNFKK